MTDNVCLGRGPVALTAERPRWLLLSFLHLAGDVENRAAGAMRMQCTEGMRNERIVSGFANRHGRTTREADMAAIA
jgi:hypothetical protein